MDISLDLGSDWGAVQKSGIPLGGFYKMDFNQHWGGAPIHGNHFRPLFAQKAVSATREFERFAV